MCRLLVTVYLVMGFGIVSAAGSGGSVIPELKPEDSIYVCCDEQTEPFFVALQEEMALYLARMEIDYEIRSRRGMTLEDAAGAIERQVGRSTVIIISAGMSDALNVRRGEGPGEPIETTMTALDTIVASAKKGESHLVLATPTIYTDIASADKAYNRHIDRVAAFIRAKAVLNDIPLIDFRAAFKRELASRNEEGKGSGVLTVENEELNQEAIHLGASLLQYYMGLRPDALLRPLKPNEKIWYVDGLTRKIDDIRTYVRKQSGQEKVELFDERARIDYENTKKMADSFAEFECDLMFLPLGHSWVGEKVSEYPGEQVAETNFLAAIREAKTHCEELFLVTPPLPSEEENQGPKYGSRRYERALEISQILTRVAHEEQVRVMDFTEACRTYIYVHGPRALLAPRNDRYRITREGQALLENVFVQMLGLDPKEE